VPGFTVTSENYYGHEAESRYLTNSQRKCFLECAARWMAKLTGAYVERTKDVYLYGQYVDVALTETPGVFLNFCYENQKRIKTAQGKKRAPFLYLDMAIETVRGEPLLMQYLSGQGQSLIVLEDFHGFPLKCKLDVLNLEQGFITDLKTAADVNKEMFSTKYMQRVTYIDEYEYWAQLAIYREAVWIKHTVDLPCYIIAVEKEPKDKEADICVNRALYELDDTDYMENEVRDALQTFKMMQKLKEDCVDPSDLPRCETCSYCIKTKVITEPLKIKPKTRF